MGTDALKRTGAKDGFFLLQTSTVQLGRHAGSSHYALTGAIFRDTVLAERPQRTSEGEKLTQQTQCCGAPVGGRVRQPSRATRSRAS